MATDDTESNEYIKKISYDETEIVNVVEESLKLSTSNSHRNKKVIILTS